MLLGSSSVWILAGVVEGDKQGLGHLRPSSRGLCRQGEVTGLAKPTPRPNPRTQTPTPVAAAALPGLGWQLALCNLVHQLHPWLTSGL